MPRKFRYATLGALLSLALTALPAQINYASLHSFTTFAGNSASGHSDGTGSAARFNEPYGLAVDGAGNVYVADTFNNTIRKITPAGVVTTLAGVAGSHGSADGTGSEARFDWPRDIAVDATGNVYVADSSNCLIRKITPDGVVTTLAGSARSPGWSDGTGSAARFYAPRGIAVDGAGNIYVADTSSHIIRKITADGVVTTLAGTAYNIGSADGTGAAAQFQWPNGIAVDATGNLYVADYGNHTIRKITAAGVVTTLAGTAGSTGSTDGTGSAARFYSPSDVTLDQAGNIYVTDTVNSIIRKISPGGAVSTHTGNIGPGGIPGSTDGTLNTARFTYPHGVAVDQAGNLYVADSFNHTIRKISSTGTVSTLAGLASGAGAADGTGSAAQFNSPGGVTVDAVENVYVADTNNHTIRKITPGGVVTTMAGNAGQTGSADGMGSTARFNAPAGVQADSNGTLYVADTYNHTIRKITATGVVTTVAGLAASSGSADGVGNAARFNVPFGVAVDGTGNVYVADTGNHTIRKITAEGVVTTLAGTPGSTGSTDGTGGAARFSSPFGLAADRTGNVYVADSDNHVIRRITPAGEVTTFAGKAGQSGWNDGKVLDARFNSPRGVAVDEIGNVYVADTGFGTIRLITTEGMVNTIGSSADPGQGSPRDGLGREAQFTWPASLAVHSSRNVYVADQMNHTIHRGVPLLAPVFTVQPSNQSVPLGSAVTFSATAIGLPTPTYQWLKAGVAISGATGSTYTIAQVAASDAGPYSVTVSNAAGYQTSLSALLTVLATAGNSDLNETVTAGHDVIFSAGAIAGSIRWQVSTDNGATWTDLTNNSTYNGATSATLTISNAGTSLNNARYRYVATHNFVVTTGSANTLTVAPLFFPYPTSLALDGAGSLYVSDSSTNTIQKVSASGLVSLVAGTSGAAGTTNGVGSAARFNQPAGLALTPQGALYVTDAANATIRYISAEGMVTTLAGSTSIRGDLDGLGTAALFSQPTGVALDAGGTLYVTDAMNKTIRKVTAEGVVTTFAGTAGVTGTTDGIGAAASFNLPTGIAVDASGNSYVADTANNTIRKITPAGAVTTLAGLPGVTGTADGAGSAALFNNPTGLTVDLTGHLYVADTGNSAIRKITPEGKVTTLAGLPGIAGLRNGTGDNAYFNQPRSITVDSAGNLFVADTGNATIRKITPAGLVTTLALSAAPSPPPPPVTPPTPPPPAPASGGSGGGGGAPSIWFVLALLALGAARKSSKEQTA